MSNDSPDESSSEYELNPPYKISAPSSSSPKNDRTSSAKSCVSNKSSSTLYSPKAKRKKMVHSTDDYSTGELNELYLEQLRLIKKRVNSLSLHGDADGLHAAGRPKSEVSNKEGTPRMLEVPPKKICIRPSPIYISVRPAPSATPLTSPTPSPPTSPTPSPQTPTTPTEPGVKYKSIWTDSTEVPNLETASCEDDDEDVDEDEDKKSESKKSVPLEPNIIILQSSPSISSKSTHSRTPSHVTSIGSPSCKLSPIHNSAPATSSHVCRPSVECKMSAPMKSDIQITMAQSKSDAINVEELSRRFSTGPVIKCHYQSDDDDDGEDNLYSNHSFSKYDKNKLDLKASIDVDDAPRSSNAFDALMKMTNIFAAGVRKFFGKRSAKIAVESNDPSVSEELVDEELEYFPDELVTRLINYSDYNIPLRKMRALPDVKSTKEIVDNMAAEVFRNSGVQLNDGDVRPATPRPSTSKLKDVMEQMKRENERRRQATDLEYYDVEKHESVEAAAKRSVTQKSSGTKGAASFDAIEEEEIEDVRWRCCNLQACAEFMFPKRTQRYF